MLVLGLDFETTGLDTVTDRIIEVGAVLWDTETSTPLAMLSYFVHALNYPRLSPEIQSLTGISQTHLDELAHSPGWVFDGLHRLVARAAAIVAHFGNKFDRLMFDAELARQGRDRNLWERFWLDTSVDVPYPDQMVTRKLSYLAAEHGFVNPFPHRAVFDVLTMLKVLSHYSMTDVVALAQEPSIELVADTLVPWRDNGVSTGLAKARGYRWDGVRKLWTKTVKQRHLERERGHNEFPVSVLG